MSGRAGSDEHYVLDLCDEVLGRKGDRQATFDWLRGDPSPARPRGAKLPVDGYWPDLGLVVEFQEEQHSQPSPFFDRRRTVSGVGRGEQRRIYDERKRALIPQHGLRLVVIEKAAFVVKSRRIVRDCAEDLAVVRDHLFDEEPAALPDDVERLFAEQREYWGMLRDSGAVDAAAEVECMRREIGGG
ncbi:hypothetical protein [Tsukamurella sp. PLM1]|uniref:hypothetical protein n=1 Tax=Tsukamurella sp. PLM1 TaxID=2929795 RepID=UPI002053B51E|nr:hypothetical protein [Tsukamurella sp. PLM1]BDH59762.1 hypothetical protein MTP03_47010 [Tsukamurella sp. PLM1]